ncbi:MAG TPA: acyl-CoA dehydrogenase family protein [Candidatus Limnocylindrales bacterium]
MGDPGDELTDGIHLLSLNQLSGREIRRLADRGRAAAVRPRQGGERVFGRLTAGRARPLALGHGGYRTLATRSLVETTGPTEERPLSWPLTDEERLLRDTAREFARRAVAPTAIERDEAERFDRSIFDEMGSLGLAGAPLPESVGGGGFSYVGWTLVMEEIGAADMASAVTLSVHILSQYPVVTWGSDEQRARWLPAMVDGSALGAFALTEPHAGSDAAALRLRAERVGSADAPDGYRLTGTKIWISNAPEADRYLVFATTDPALGPKGIAAFLVEKGIAGFSFGAHEKKMGIRACPAAELVFEDCFVPVANRLGAEGEGYRIALSALAEGRISIAAACVGMARSALEAAAAYLRQRRAFGGVLAERETLRFMLAEMARDVEAARALTRQAAAAKDRGEAIGVASSLAKWTASDTAMRVATDAVQLFGASGYSRETGIERLMRDAKGAQIYEGTNQIHRAIVADDLLAGLPPE